MAEIDTSSYAKPPAYPAQKSLIDQVGDYQKVESQGITINKQKLDLINTQFGLMNQELSTLADPEGNNGKPFTKEQAAQKLTTFANTYKFPPEVTQHMLGELQASPDVPMFARKSIIRGMDTNQKVNNLYAQPGSTNNGQTTTPTVTSPMLNGGAPRATMAPIQQQIPPNQPVIGPDNRETLQGPTPAVTPPGTVAGPSFIAPTPQNFRSATSNDTANNNVVSRYPAPSGPSVGQSPLFEEGKKQYVEDQNLAASKLTDIKPAQLALSLMKDLRSGPGTPTWNHAIALLKANNVIPTQAKDDPTAIYQEVNKYLNQYVQKNGSRSDADLAQREASNPSVGVQINPALVKLTSSQVARDKIEAARHGAFGSNDYSKYGQHKATFPNKMDQRAFEIDNMEPKERNNLLKEMDRKLNSKNAKDRAEALKFKNSLEVADKQGLVQ